MKEYVPVFFDWVEVTGELNAQEKGRLIDAIVLYARGGDWQEQIKGNERYLFPAFKKCDFPEVFNVFSKIFPVNLRPFKAKLSQILNREIIENMNAAVIIQTAVFIHIVD